MGVVFGIAGAFFLVFALFIMVAPGLILALDKMFSFQMFTQEVIKNRKEVRLSLGLLFLCASFFMFSLLSSGSAQSRRSTRTVDNRVQ